MSFGYGVGDFIAGANLAHKLIRVMAETRGASEEYQDAMTELCGIQQAFIHVSQITRSNLLPQATLNSASCIVLSSMDIIARFLERTREYRKMLDSNTGGANSMSRSWCKVGWSLYKRDELRSLRDSLHCRLVAINTLFAAAKHEHALPMSVSQYRDVEDNGATSATGSGDSGIDLIDSTFGSNSNTARRVRRLDRIEREKVEAEVQARLKAARAEWAAERDAAADEWRKEFTAQTKAAAMDEARAKLEVEEQVKEKMRAAEEERKRAEYAMKKEIMQAAMQEVEENLKKRQKAPIKFKDAIGRKFTFPFHLAQTWQGMEDLIKQAFLHIDVIGPHVQEGHYDLIGPDGEVILPTVWERVIEPDWSITMQMWPMDKTPPLHHRQPFTISSLPGHGHPRPLFLASGGGSLPGRFANSTPGLRPREGVIPPPPGWGSRPSKPRPEVVVDVSDSESMFSTSSRSDTENDGQHRKRGFSLGRLVPSKVAKLKLWKRSGAKKDKDDSDSDLDSS